MAAKQAGGVPEVSGGGNAPGGMNPSPTDDPVTIVDRKAAEGSRPLPTEQVGKGVLTVGRGPGMPGPYRVQ